MDDSIKHEPTAPYSPDADLLRGSRNGGGVIKLDAHGSPILEESIDFGPPPPSEPQADAEEPPWGEIDVIPADQAPPKPLRKGVYRELAERLLEKLIDGADRRYVVTVSFGDPVRARQAARTVAAIFSRLRGEGAVEVWATDDSQGNARLCIRRSKDWA